jgi:hypothetical protein
MFHLNNRLSSLGMARIWTLFNLNATVALLGVSGGVAHNISDDDICIKWSSPRQHSKHDPVIFACRCVAILWVEKRLALALSATRKSV